MDSTGSGAFLATAALSLDWISSALLFIDLIARLSSVATGAPRSRDGAVDGACIVGLFTPGLTTSGVHQCIIVIWDY